MLAPPVAAWGIAIRGVGVSCGAEPGWGVVSLCPGAGLGWGICGDGRAVMAVWGAAAVGLG